MSSSLTSLSEQVFRSHPNARAYVVPPRLLDQPGWYAAVLAADVLTWCDQAEPEPDAEPVDDSALRFSLLDMDPLPGEPGKGDVVGEIKGSAVAKIEGIKVTHVTYQCLRATAQYENDRVEMRAELRDGEDPRKVAGKLRDLCEKSISDRRSKSGRRSAS